jgi:hypothetical protein
MPSSLSKAKRSQARSIGSTSEAATEVGGRTLILIPISDVCLPGLQLSRGKASLVAMRIIISAVMAAFIFIA